MNKLDITKAIKVLNELKDSFGYILPDDDFFWENYREDVSEVYNHIDTLKKLFIKALGDA